MNVHVNLTDDAVANVSLRFNKAIGVGAGVLLVMDKDDDPNVVIQIVMSEIASWEYYPGISVTVSLRSGRAYVFAGSGRSKVDECLTEAFGQ